MKPLFYYNPRITCVNCGIKDRKICLCWTTLLNTWSTNGVPYFRNTVYITATTFTYNN